MSSYQETFKRKEVKYLLNAQQYAAFRATLEAHMEIDEYGASGIDSLYYDTFERSVIERSLEKPYYKEKLRVRKYRADVNDRMYVELKKKVNGIVYKRRVQMPSASAKAYMAGKSFEEAMAQGEQVAGEHQNLDGATRQIAREIDAFKMRHLGLRPSMVISVMRTAWRPRPDKQDAEGLRITFDEDPRYTDMMVGASGYRQVAPRTGRLVREGEAIMEIKCQGAYPLWLVELLNEVKAYPTSFSKYGEAYKICTGTKASEGAPARSVKTRKARAIA